MIGWQIQYRRSTFQLLPPESKVCIALCAGEHPVLPFHKIAVSRGGGKKRMRPARTGRGIEFQKLGKNTQKRQRVEDQMVGSDQQQVIVSPVCKQVRSEEGAVSQIEWLPKGGGNLGVYFGSRTSGCVDRFERDGAARVDLLNQLARCVNSKNCAKGVMTVDDRLQRRLESWRVWRREDSYAERKVINGAVRQNLLDEPQGFLAGREWKDCFDAVTYWCFVLRRSQGCARVRFRRPLCGFEQLRSLSGMDISRS